MRFGGAGGQASFEYDPETDRLVAVLPDAEQAALVKLLQRIGKAQAGLTKARDGLLANEADAATPAWETAIRERLRQPIDLEVNGTPLGDVLGILHKRAGVNVVLDPTVDAQTPPTLAVEAMPAHRVCGWICRLTNLPDPSIRDGAVYFGRDDGGAACLRLYKIRKALAADRDLLARIRETVAPESWDGPMPRWRAGTAFSWWCRPRRCTAGLPTFWRSPGAEARASALQPFGPGAAGFQAFLSGGADDGALFPCWISPIGRRLFVDNLRTVGDFRQIWRKSC